MILQWSKNIKKEDIFKKTTFSREIRDTVEVLLHRGNNDEIILFFKIAFSNNLDVSNLHIFSNYGVI